MLPTLFLLQALLPSTLGVALPRDSATEVIESDKYASLHINDDAPSMRQRNKMPEGFAAQENEDWDEEDCEEDWEEDENDRGSNDRSGSSGIQAGLIGEDRDGGRASSDPNTQGGNRPSDQAGNPSPRPPQEPTRNGGTSTSDQSRPGSDRSEEQQAPQNPAPEGNGDNAKRGGPVGLGWDVEENSADLSTWISNGLQWWYQWSLKPTFKDVDIEFVPQVWGPDNAPEVKDAMASWPQGTKYVLSFNEPDIKDGQSGEFFRDVRHAAELHNLVSDTLGDKYELATPGVSTGLPWLEEWDKECKALTGASCRYDFINAHYYGTSPEDLIQIIKDLHSRFKKPVWVTEWGCHVFVKDENGNYPPPCTPAQADHLMKSSIEWFRGEGKDIVDRWAWFGAFNDMVNWQDKYNMDANRIANHDGTVSEKGKAYLSM